MSLVFEFANLWYPYLDGGDILFSDGQVVFTPTTQHDGFVKDPLSNQASAEVSFSVNEASPDSWWAMYPFQTRLRAWMKTDYGVFLVFNGIITEPELDTETETITVGAVDDTIRLQNHFIRLGDQVLNTAADTGDFPLGPNPYGKGNVPLSGEGLRMIMNAARNFGDQQQDYPPLGISDGWDDYTWTGTPTVQFSRGDQVFESMLQVCETQVGPEFKLLPVANVPGVYHRFYTAPKVGLHDPVYDIWLPDEDTVTSYFDPTNETSGWVVGYDQPVLHTRFEAGFGYDNCEIKHKPGGRLVSHVHVLSDDSAKTNKRVTVSSFDTARTYGVYVDWEQTQFKASNVDALTERGQQVLTAYRNPQQEWQITVKGSSRVGYMKDFLLGSRVTAAYKSGPFFDFLTGRVMEVTLTQDDESLFGHKTELTIVDTVMTSGTEEDF